MEENDDTNEVSGGMLCNCSEEGKLTEEGLMAAIYGMEGKGFIFLSVQHRCERLLTVMSTVAAPSAARSAGLKASMRGLKDLSPPTSTMVGVKLKSASLDCGGGGLLIPCCFLRGAWGGTAGQASFTVALTAA